MPISGGELNTATWTAGARLTGAASPFSGRARFLILHWPTSECFTPSVTFRAYHDRVFERFWKRELDIESPAALAAVLAECGADIGGFVSFIENEGRRELNEIMREAEDAGVFGVPSFLFDSGDLYWGREHLARIRELLGAA